MSKRADIFDSPDYWWNALRIAERERNYEKAAEAVRNLKRLGYKVERCEASA
jgi:hypothetical protein